MQDGFLCAYWKVSWIVFEIFVYLLLSIHQKEIKTMPKTCNLCIYVFKKAFSVSMAKTVDIYYTHNAILKI